MQDQIERMKNQIRVLSILQYVMPLLMILMAVAAARTMPLVAIETKKILIGLLGVFALADFVLIRFYMLPITRKRLAELENGQ